MGFGPKNLLHVQTVFKVTGTFYNTVRSDTFQICFPCTLIWIMFEVYMYNIYVFIGMTMWTENILPNI